MSDLNKKQFEAVETVNGPVVIIAGPGTGKTKTLVERTVNILVNKKVEAKKIMITTFTNKAAKELELRINERLEELNKNIDISDIYLGTMHSIWTRLIQENITYSNFFDNFELMSGDYEQHFFIYSRLKEYKKLEAIDNQIKKDFKEKYKDIDDKKFTDIYNFLKRKGTKIGIYGKEYQWNFKQPKLVKLLEFQ